MDEPGRGRCPGQSFAGQSFAGNSFKRTDGRVSCRRKRLSPSRSMLSPLREPIFRALWIAAFVSNIGSFMQEIGSAWLMTSLAPTPFLVALLQTALYLPYFLLALPAGAFADVFDRRRLLIIGQIWMLIAAAALGLVCIFNLVNAWTLLTLTFMLAVGGAITGPAWNAAIPELVSKENLEPAIAIGSVGYNVARGIGCALGGLAVAALGPGPVFILNAVTFIGVVIVFWRWKQAPVEYSTQPGEKIPGAMKAGLRFVRHSPALISVFVRSTAYAICTSAMWALIPLIAKDNLKLNSGGYGLLLAFFGLGTLLGAIFLPRVRRTVSLDHVTVFGKIAFAVALVGLAYAQHAVTAAIFMVIFGVSWIVVNSCLSMGAQKASPQWVRARALAVHILLFLGSFALASAGWGQLAVYTGLTTPLLVAAAGLAISLFLTPRFPLIIAESLDTTLSDHWTNPKVAVQPHPDHGPVLITVEYLIDPARSREFAHAMNLLALQRKRDGAFQWHLFFDVANPSKQIETFMVESWAEHMRQHERVTISDREAEDRVAAFHIGEKLPVVRHLVNAYDGLDERMAIVPINIFDQAKTFATDARSV